MNAHLAALLYCTTALSANFQIRNLRPSVLQLELQAGRDTTKGVSNVCPVHKAQMRIARAPIVYGLLMVRPTDPPRDVRSREFPFALDYLAGGCVVGDYTEAKIYICPDCQHAEKQWRKTHSK